MHIIYSYLNITIYHCHYKMYLHIPDILSMMHIRIDITFIIYLGVHIIYRHNIWIGTGTRFNVKNTTPHPVQFRFFFAACIKVCCLTTKTVSRYRAAAGKPTERKRTIVKKTLQRVGETNYFLISSSFGNCRT